MLQYDFVRTTEQEVAKLFGQRFAEQLLEVPEGSWQRPCFHEFRTDFRNRVHDHLEISVTSSEDDSIGTEDAIDGAGASAREPQPTRG